MKWHERIVIDPNILTGKPTIRGTRLSVQFLLELFAEGWSAEQVLSNYPQITDQDLQAVFAYGAAHLKDEEIRIFQGS